jgi:hypothetical protein
MKAAEVRILRTLDPGESYVEPTFVLVETTIDRQGEAATTIEHVTSYTLRGRPRWKIVTLGQSVPLSHASALEWAVSFAASRDIPVVYQRDDSVGIGGYAAALSLRGSRATVSAAK